MSADKGFMVNTPEGIAYFQLASLKGQLKLESKGLKSSGGAIRPRWAKELGLKARDSHDVFIAAVQKRMDAILEARANEPAKA